MKFKVDGKSIEVADSLLLAAGQHAETRGMSLEEYIAEAFTMLKERPSIIPAYPEGKYEEVHVVKNLDISYEPELQRTVRHSMDYKEKNLASEQLRSTDLNYDGDWSYDSNGAYIKGD